MDILNEMQLTRDYCRLILRLRATYKIPVSYPLYEAQLSGVPMLTKEFRDLISDECNVDWVEPFFSKFSDYDTVVEAEEGDLKVRLSISQDHHLERRYQERIERRAKAEERKLKNEAFCILLK